MPHNPLHALAILTLLGATAQAEPRLVQRQPTVVHEGRSTIPAQPYYGRLKQKDATGRSLVAAPHGATVIPLEERLPLSPGRLVVGRPAMQTVPGLTTPLFVMGMDEVSLSWFSQAADGLSGIGARGVVVQAERLDDWQALRQQARVAGIDLMLMAGDSLAQGYGIRTYPMVLMSPELAHKGMHE